MKHILALVCLLGALSAFAQSYTMSRDTLNGSLMNFVGHQGAGPNSSYLSMEIPFSPVKKLHKELSKRSKLKLISHGEAHITVVTPPEYYSELKGYLTMDEIDSIALAMDIQKSQFKIKCLGSASLVIDGALEKTFYLVVESEDLLKIRRKIVETIQSRGGSPVLFSPEKFFPHITVGYTKRDLHESDGIFKDVATCIEKVDIY